MYGSDDPAVKAAALADQRRRNRGRKSIMKDSEKYAEELGVDISTDEGKIKSSMREARISQYLYSPTSTINILELHDTLLVTAFVAH